MGVLRDRMIEEMKLQNFTFLYGDAGILRLRGKQTGQISQQITGSAQQGRHPSFSCASHDRAEVIAE